jgi:uncharacterized membrane protein YqjE
MTVTDQDQLRQRSTGELVKDLSQQASTLVRQEIQLAKVELAEKGRKLGVGLAAAAGAATAALLALGTLTAFVVLALDGAMPNWAAALIVALIWAAVALALVLYARQKLEDFETPVPEDTVRTLKEDIEWLKHPTN